MLKLKITWVSKSGTTALAVVTRKVGFVSSTIANGMIKVDVGTKVGDELELPNDTAVSTTTTTSVNEETGETRDWNWIVLG